MSIEIPLKNRQGEVVEVFLDDLPSDPHEIEAILRDEEASVDLWLRFAREYYNRNDIKSFQVLLNSALSSRDLRRSKNGDLDTISILTSLAAAYISAASKERRKEKRDEYFALATSRINDADKIDENRKSLEINLVKGYFHLNKGDAQMASYSFESCEKSEKLDRGERISDSIHILTLIGKGCVKFNQKSYEEALKIFQKALEICPRLVEPRIGIGMCFHKVGDLEKARIAYERALEMDPNSVQALVGLVVLDLNTKTNDSIRSGLERLKKAYSIDKSNPEVLNLLANHFFFKQDLKKVESLARTAIYSSQVHELQSESYFYLAKCFHFTKNYDSALKYYRDSLQLNPNFSLSQFGLGQMFLHQGDIFEARKCFEGVLQKEPNNYETMKILGSLYLREQPSDFKKSEELLKKVVEQNPEDIEAYIELAESQESTNLRESLKSYEKVTDLWKKHIKSKMPAELLNNMGSAHFYYGKIEDASRLFQEALESCLESEQETPEEKEYLDSLITIVKYNLSRSYEELGEEGKSITLLKEILKKNSKYIDGLLALASLKMKNHHYSEALEYINEALTIDPENLESKTLLGILQIRKKEIPQSKKTFEAILSSDKHDAYGLVSLGNIFRVLSKTDKSKSEKAVESYCTALRHQPRNAYAANGIGVMLAEKGHFQEAKEIFLKIREAMSSFPDSFMNLAHVHTEMGSHVHAIAIYENCLKKFFENKDVPTLIYIARAYYFQGREQQNVEDIIKAQKYLQKALLMRPSDNSLRFNIALVQQEAAYVVIKKATSERTSEQVRRARRQVESASEIFNYLKDTEPYPPQSYEKKMAHERAKYIDEKLKKLTQDELEKQENEERAKKQNYQSLESRIIQQKEEEMKKKEEDLKRKKEIEEEIEQKRREIHEKGIQVLQTNKQNEEDTPKRKKKVRSDDSDSGSETEKTKKKRRSKKEQSEKGEDSEGEERKRRKKNKKRKERREEDVRESSVQSESEDEATKRERGLQEIRKKRRSNKNAESEEQKDEGENEEETKGRSRKRLKKRMMKEEIESDEEEEKEQQPQRSKSPQSPVREASVENDKEENKPTSRSPTPTQQDDEPRKRRKPQIVTEDDE